MFVLNWFEVEKVIFWLNFNAGLALIQVESWPGIDYRDKEKVSKSMEKHEKTWNKKSKIDLYFWSCITADFEV